MDSTALRSRNPGIQRFVTMHPPAKINLSLWIGKKRPDNYHEIHSVMAAVDLRDELKIFTSDTPGIKLSCSGLDCPETPENLVYQAADLLARNYDIDPAIHIHLHKNIPAGGGLGGASSDAAFTLMALNHLWNLNLEHETLDAHAAELGSDVAFFLHTPVALCTGRGEIVTSIPAVPRLHALLIIPGIHVATAEVYRNYSPDQDLLEQQMQLIQKDLDRADLDTLTRRGINSLTNVTMNLCEKLRFLQENLEKIGINPVFMSGSGSTLFCVHHAPEWLEKWSEMIKNSALADAQVVSFLDHSDKILEVHHAAF